MEIALGGERALAGDADKHVLLVRIRKRKAFGDGQAVPHRHEIALVQLMLVFTAVRVSNGCEIV